MHEYRSEYPDGLTEGRVRGRGAQVNPSNRFEPIRLDVLGEHLDEVMVEHPEGVQVATRVYRDNAKTMINRVESADIPFGWSINAYRGCEHGCVYCYARPTHETFGLSCGIDFETKIFAKMDAVAILRKELGRPGWKGEPIMMSGITDPYQPVEKSLGITRGILELFAACRQPVSIITKNRLILRDLDLLRELASCDAVRVAVSVTTLDARLSAKMEPRASAPLARLDAIGRLADAGIPVSVMAAPMIPALNDCELPSILKAAKDRGATGAGWVMLRLPWQVKDVFLVWLAREFPDRAAKVISQIRGMRDGGLYDHRAGVRQRGEGARAEQMGEMFDVWTRRLGLNGARAPLSSARFRGPGGALLWD